MTYPGPTNPPQPQAETIYYDGNRLLAAGDIAGAEARYRAALALAPDFPEALGNLALVLERRGEVAAAENAYRRALALNPTLAQLHCNLGALLFAQKRFDAAEASYRTALDLRPLDIGAWSNLGVLLACVKREAEGEACYLRALEIDPAHANAAFNLSYLLLRQGRWDEGWRRMEARDWYAALAARVPCPRWQGEDVAGKALLLGAEAGYGDMIQMCRYATLLKARGARRIDLLCPPVLYGLFATLAGVDDLVGFDDALAGPWDFWTPLFSIPGHCGTRVDSVPADIPYLFADAARVAHWRAQLPSEGLRVGIVWKGNPRFENDADRSLPGLATLAPLFAVPGVAFVSLQKGEGKDEAAMPPTGMTLVDLGSRVADFADTAAIVAGLDLVIAVDTAVAHLAGALGTRCWLLLPDYRTDWRWLTGRNDTPWYPGVMRLFRQRAPGEWDSVVAEVEAALRELARR